MFIRIDTTEVTALSAKLARATTTVGPKAGVVIRKTAYSIERDAKSFAPVDTGNLRNSISTKFSSSIIMIRADIGPTAEYGIYQELGTSRMPPQPFLRPATERNQEAFNRAVQQIGEDAL